MSVGIVKWYDGLKGYGFIESNGTEVFVHVSEVERAGLVGLVPGQSVSYTISSDRGVQASNLQIF